MVATAPGSSPLVVRDAHYHAIKATATWKAYLDGVRALTTASAAKRAREDLVRQRETTYARGTLGGH